MKGLFKQVVRMRFPIGIQNFRTLREDGYLYIDKTELIYKLVDTGCYYLLSRPRRFGKSLLVSTLEAYFQGKKEQFKGLAMERLEKDWTGTSRVSSRFERWEIRKYPVAFGYVE